MKIKSIIKKLNIKSYELYGEDKAKIEPMDKVKGKLILVSSINPTKFGEGKTTVSIGLADSMNELGKNTILALREPSLGPVFGVKGGATGGGKSSLTPSDDINLHFTGDFHAITSANNLLCALIDNHIYHGNELNIDENEIYFHRCIDMNDRALREVTISKEKLKGNVERNESFTITAASEIMTILCLSQNLDDLKLRLGNILVALSKSGNPIYAHDLKAEGAMTLLLKDAIKPNLVRTLSNSPALVHCGPFANISIGCNSIIATKTALSLSDYVVTEAGFGADLGAEKFIDLKCREFDLNPSAVVIVITIRALKEHDSNGELSGGLENLTKHINNFVKVYNKTPIVAINKFDDDKIDEINLVIDYCKGLGIKAIPCEPYTKSCGCMSLAEEVVKMADKRTTKLKYAYDLRDSIRDKIISIAKNIYGAKNVIFTDIATKKMEKFEILVKNYPIVIAKTQYSLSDDEKLKGEPKDFDFHVKDLEIKTGAGYVLVIAGKMNLMPGLSKHPNSENM